jgi:hypothetical protein
MEQTDWRLEQARRFARRMMVNCDACPDCGAMVCSDRGRDLHIAYHNTENVRWTQARDAIIALQDRAAASEAAISNLRSRATALENRATAIETKNTEQDTRLTAIEARLPAQ